MKRSQKRAIYAQALNRYGLNSQVFMVFEEMGELQDALAKYIRGRVTTEAVITELADVSIMVEQMAQYFGVEDFRIEKERKLDRLAIRLSSPNTNNSNNGKTTDK